MSSIRKIFVVATGVFALGAASAAFAGLSGKVLEQVRDRAEKEQQQSQPASAPAPAPRSQESSPRSREPSPRAQDSGPRRQQSAPQVQQPSAAQRAQAPMVGPVQPRNRGNDNRSGDAGRGNDNGRNNAARDNNARSNNGGVLGESLARNFRNGDAGRDNNRNDHRNDRPRQRQVVPQLPRGYRNYNWNGRPYYTYGGRWYEPYGSSYISIGVPYGLFVSTLPGYSTSFYYGNTRYYYYDDTYYTYEPVRRGYLVAQSPYGDEEDADYYYDERDEDMYIYPSQGQSEQQQADDRYACHRWAVDQSGYDPIDDEYDRDKRAEYVRAMTACLTGRGYSVR